MTKLHKTTTALLLAAALLLSGCSERGNSPAQGVGMTNSTESTNENSSADSESSKNSTSEPESEIISSSANSSDDSSGSYDGIFNHSDLGLKGEDLIAKFEWPYDAPIDIEGMTAKRMDVGDNGNYTFNDIQLIDISNTFDWVVNCDYGYLALTPENGGEYEYKKYKAGDKIGDFTVTDIETTFRNFEHFGGYFAGAEADFEGEAVLVGEVYEAVNESQETELYFFPDERSRKKLPVVNFIPKLYDDLGYYDKYFSYDNVWITLGDRADHPELDLKGIPEDGTRVKVKLKINKYSYRAECGSSVIGSVNIVDGSFEFL